MAELEDGFVLEGFMAELVARGGTELEIGGVVPFVDVKQVLNVNRLV